MDEFKILSDVINSVWVVLTIGFTVGYAVCKMFIPKERPVTTTKLDCVVPIKYIGATAKHNEISKTFHNHNSKVVDVSCYYKGAKNVCVLTKKKCYHYDS